MPEDLSTALEQAYFESAKQHLTWSGLACKEAYGPQDVGALAYAERLGDPGQYPYTRGVYGNMYRGRLWTRREVCGFGSGRDTNERMRFQVANGVSGLSVIDDNNGSLGIDADHPMGIGDAGVQGVSVSSLADFEDLFDGIPIERVSVSFDISGLDSIAWMALYIALAQKRGIDPSLLRGTVQNDTLHFQFCGYGDSCPVDLGLKASVDIMEYCTRHMPRWYSGNVNFYDLREQGLDAPQELAFGFSEAIEYTERAVARGLRVDDFAPRRAFYCSCHIDFFEEIAKLRAARRMWARIMRDHFKARNPKSWMLRFHTQTAGSTLTAQQPENNIVRTALQAMSAVLGGTQSLHTNSFDEALALPTETSARIALRTQQIIAYESGAPQTIDPLGGSYYIEWLTNQVEAHALGYLEKIDAMGGMLKAIERGFVQQEIQNAAYEYQRAVDHKEAYVVGVNSFEIEQEHEIPLQHIDESLERKQVERLKALRAKRDPAKWAAAVQRVEETAKNTGNLMPVIIEAVEANATVGEISDAMRHVYGEYRETVVI